MSDMLQWDPQKRPTTAQVRDRGKGWGKDKFILDVITLTTILTLSHPHRPSVLSTFRWDSHC